MAENGKSAFHCSLSSLCDPPTCPVHGWHVCFTRSRPRTFDTGFGHRASCAVLFSLSQRPGKAHKSRHHLIGGGHSPTVTDPLSSLSRLGGGISTCDAVYKGPSGHASAGRPGGVRLGWAETTTGGFADAVVDPGGVGPRSLRLYPTVLSIYLYSTTTRPVCAVGSAPPFFVRFIRGFWLSYLRCATRNQ